MSSDEPISYLSLQESRSEQLFSLDNGNCWRIGRDGRSSIVIARSPVSRDHAMIQRFENGAFCLIDLGSRNGSFVNGHRVVVPVTLSDGDEIAFGETQLTFHQRAESMVASSPEDSRRDDATRTLRVSCLISVLVVDIRDFTCLAQKVEDTVLARAIGTWFRRAGRIINRSGSRVHKYIGDAVMAVWVHPNGTPKDPDLLQILSALCDIEKITGKLQSQFRLPSAVRIGAGLNTGYALIGNAVSGKDPEYTALGDTVNAAFRLESTTKRLEQDLALGQRTYDCFSAASNAGQHFRQQTVELKGYEHPTTAWVTRFDRLKAFLQWHNVGPCATRSLVSDAA